MIINSDVLYNLGKNVLFDKIECGENSLLLYDNVIHPKQIFKNFMQQKENNSIFYIARKKDKLKCDSNIQTYFFNIINEDVIHELKTKLNKCFSQIEKTGRPLHVIADWSDVNLEKCEIFLPFLNALINKSHSLNPPPWKRSYKNKIKQKIPFLLINGFDITNYGAEFISQIIKMHQRVYLLQKNCNTFFLPTTTPSLETIFPKSHVLPQKILEKLTKDNLELVTLLFLEKSAKSGYQILKDVASHFHCILSQGTLYPLLYQMEKENKIIKQNGKGREVIYSLSKQTKENLQLKKETCLKAYQHLASFFEN